MFRQIRRGLALFHEKKSLGLVVRLLENSGITHIIATGIFDDDNSILTMDSVIVGLK